MLSCSWVVYHFLNSGVQSGIRCEWNTARRRAFQTKVAALALLRSHTSTSQIQLCAGCRISRFLIQCSLVG